MTRIYSIIIVFFCLLVPTHIQAEESLTRAEGFIQLWAPLKRPAKETYETPFTDVPKTHEHNLVLTYAKARGVVNDDERFFPDESLRLNDALLWLFRSRNVDEWNAISYQTLADYIRLYRVFDVNSQFSIASLEENPEITSDDLSDIMEHLRASMESETHSVSYYSDGFVGRNTAFGEIFNPNALTAAHRTLPQNTLVEVTNEENGKSVTVRINDRGPYIDGRDMDLSRAAFQRISPIGYGLLHNVTFRRLGSAAQIGSCAGKNRRVRYQRRLGEVMLSPGIPTIINQGQSIELTGDHEFRILQMRAPGQRPLRMRDWKKNFTIEYAHEGIYSFVLHSDGGKRRRFRTRVISACQ